METINTTEHWGYGRLQAKVRERGLELRPKLNDGLVCDAQGHCDGTCSLQGAIWVNLTFTFYIDNPLVRESEGLLIRTSNAYTSETVRATKFKFGGFGLRLCFTVKKVQTRIKMEEPMHHMTIRIGLSNPRIHRPADCRPTVVNISFHVLDCWIVCCSLERNTQSVWRSDDGTVPYTSYRYSTKRLQNFVRGSLK